MQKGTIVQKNTNVFVNFTRAAGVDPYAYEVTDVVEFDQGDGGPKAVALYASDTGEKLEIILPDALCREIIRTWAMIDLKVAEKVN